MMNLNISPYFIQYLRELNLGSLYSTNELCEQCLSNRQYLLSSGREKVFSDPIYGMISFEPDELVIIDSCFLQRLRHIQQTSFLYFLFPSARHTRFEHSLGVAHVAKKIYNILRTKGDLYDFYYDLLERKRITNELEKGLNIDDLIDVLINIEYKVVVYSALLHDIGHFPFSHEGEKLYNVFKTPEPSRSIQLPKEEFYKYSKPHEVESYWLIKSRKIHGFRNCLYYTLKGLFKEILESFGMNYKLLFKLKHKRLNLFPDTLVKKCARYVLSSTLEMMKIVFQSEGKSQQSADAFMRDNPLHLIINGSWIDADKLDYLLRDAYFAGFDLTKGFNVDRLIRGLTLKKYKNCFVIAVEDKTLPEVLNLSQGRYLLQNSVLSHPVNEALSASFNTILHNFVKQKIQKAKFKEQSVQCFYNYLRKMTDEEIISILRNYVDNIKSQPSLYKELAFCMSAIRNRVIPKAVAVFEVENLEVEDDQVHLIEDKLTQEIKNCLLNTPSLSQLPLENIFLNIEKIRFPAENEIKIYSRIDKKIINYKQYSKEKERIFYINKPPGKIGRVYLLIPPEVVNIIQSNNLENNIAKTVLSCIKSFFNCKRISVVRLKSN